MGRTMIGDEIFEEMRARSMKKLAEVYMGAYEDEIEEMVEHPEGGKSGRCDYNFKLVGPNALLRLAKLMYHNMRRHGVKHDAMWYDLNQVRHSCEDHVSRAITHLLQFMAGGDEIHLDQAMARVMFAIESKLRREGRDGLDIHLRTAPGEREQHKEGRDGGGADSGGESGILCSGASPYVSMEARRRGGRQGVRIKKARGNHKKL